MLVKYEEGDEPLFAIAPDAKMAAAYYRNAMLHFLVNGAIGEMAFLYVAQLDVANRREAFREQALRIRDVLKFEFFFAEKQEFPRRNGE